MIDNPRLLLSKLRNGDYAHAGETEAIDIVLNKIKEIEIKSEKNKKLLDLGCGLGGTAEYIRLHTDYDLYGLDIDFVAVDYARKYYNNVKFFNCDINNLSDEVVNNRFDIMTMFNVFYALQCQRDSLKTLAEIANPGAILAIFDYTTPHQNKFVFRDLSGTPMNPVSLNDLLRWLNETSWELIETHDMSSQYFNWYNGFLINLRSRKNYLSKEFTEETINKVNETFSFLLSKIEKKEIGGHIIYAKKI